MSQELLFISICLLDLFLILLAFRLGKNYLLAMIVGHILFTNMVSSKLINVFGLDGTVGNVFYAAIFLATDLLSEHHGKKAAFQSVKLGFFTLMILIIFGPLINLFQSVEYTMLESDSLEVIFGKTARISIASLVAYVLSNTFDVWWYEILYKKFNSKKLLFLRNIGSTSVSQLLDNTVFVLLAFAGTVPNSVLLQIWLAGYAIKLMIAVLDTPFMYISYWIKPKAI